MSMAMNEGVPARFEKWMEETPPMKRFAILLPTVILLSLLLVWSWNWTNPSWEEMLGAFMVNVFVFFLVIVPLTRFWKGMKSN
tara:strand:- start:197 stop:445 length:249 start_codon:yes stop_codon:yes gene_type:complete